MEETTDEELRLRWMAPGLGADVEEAEDLVKNGIYAGYSAAYDAGQLRAYRAGMQAGLRCCGL